MRPSLIVAGTVVAALIASPALPATADPDGPTSTATTATARPVGSAAPLGEMVRGQAREQVPDTVAGALDLRRATAAGNRADLEGEGDGFDAPLVMPTSYPFQAPLREPAAEPVGSDATTVSGVLAHSALAPQVNDWMADSDLVSAQVVGRSVQGRDLYLVTVTAPETAAQTAQQAAWRHEIRNDAATAASDPALKAGYKTPIWFSANIHGNEWEGTDGIMGYIGDLLDAETAAATQTLVEEHRLYFYLTINPDGRTIGQRPGVLGLDINRDMITSTTPESIAFTKVAREVQPLYSADLHGYTNVLQVEPCGPPHGDNYDYDLFIGHGYAAALQVEREMLDAAIPGNPLPNGQITIPYRDTPSGWDDYPPVFTAQYTAYYGAVTSTVELPLPRAGTTQTPATSAINTAVATQTITSLVDYVGDHSDDMLANQIEIFRRGEAGAPKVQLTGANIAAVPGPAEWKPLWDVADDQEPVQYPRAYVLPRGAGQRSQTDADRLVAHLLFNEIEVSTLDAATTIGGTTYPAGSYVVDMHQPLRGLANALLDVGSDISAKVPSMYDVSAWSYSYLWGASVEPVGLTSDAPIGAATPVTAPTAPAPAPAGPRTTTFDLAGVPDHRALNDLLETGASVNLSPDGSVVVPATSYAAAVSATVAHGVELRVATPAQVTAAGGPGARTLTDLHVGYVGTQEDTLALTEMGFDDLEVMDTFSAATLADVDVLWVGSALGVTDGTAADTALQAWVDAGHSILGRGTAGLAAAEQYSLLSATATTGTSDANGIVALTTPSASPLAPYAQDSGFIYPAVAFTELGAGTEMAQAYGPDPFLAGHWAPSSLTSADGPAAFAGKASAISSVKPSGSRSLVFGTSLLFRTHTKGGIGQVARALQWAASRPPVALPQDPAGPVDPDSVATVTGLRQVGRTTYPGRAHVLVTVASADGSSARPPGEVVVRSGNKVIARKALASGRATLALPVRRPGQQRVTATYLPSSDASGPAYSSSTSTTIAAVTRKATSLVSVRAVRLAAPRVQVSVTLYSKQAGTPTGAVQVLLDGRVVKRVNARASDRGRRTVVLSVPPGRHQLRATYSGNVLFLAGRSPARAVPAR